MSRRIPHQDPALHHQQLAVRLFSTRRTLTTVRWEHTNLDADQSRLSSEENPSYRFFSHKATEKAGHCCLRGRCQERGAKLVTTQTWVEGTQRAMKEERESLTKPWSSPNGSRVRNRLRSSIALLIKACPNRRIYRGRLSCIVRSPSLISITAVRSEKSRLVHHSITKLVLRRSPCCNASFAVFQVGM